MKLNFLLLFTVPLVFLFTSPPVKNSTEYSPIKIADDTTDTTTKKWIDDFKSFRDAVYKNDTAKLKTFFKFPVLNPANEIWYLVLNEKELEQKNLTGTIISFTEKDLNKYYKKLFPESFVKAVLKIKSEQLFKKRKAETPELKDTTTTTIKMYASVDNGKSILTLNLSYNTAWKEGDEGVSDGGESNVIYSFRIIKNRHLQFMYVRIAG